MESLIRSLKSPELTATCSKCRKLFLMSDALLFDGTKPFPPEAEGKQEEYDNTLQTLLKKLEKKQIAATTRATTTTEAVNIGQMIEHIVPALEEFSYEPTDCRVLFDPIDLVIFNGLAKSNVESVTFLEIKTGRARLNAHQKMIFEAVEKKKVFFEEV